MILLKKAEDLSRWLEKRRSEGRTIGFVPTMGALHEGHISLIDISKKAMDITVCSIFVNPTQFNDPKDFQKYPITIEKDILMLEQAGTDVLYLPELSDIYPGGVTDLEQYDLGSLETLLEGAFRPGHFQGVCQVMRRLLEAVRPDGLFMGQKDYQQCMVVRRLLEIMGMPPVLHPSPIIREADGLAMSSRNVRLTTEQRAKATTIYQALIWLKEAWTAGVGQEMAADRMGKPEAERIRELDVEGMGKLEAERMRKPEAEGIRELDVEGMGKLEADRMGKPEAEGIRKLEASATAFLEERGFRVDYVAIADPVTLEPLTVGQGPSVALIAAFMGEIRLIDNMSLAK
jgi:pantoate--beta-alanine ligase